jgi:hypothetical protein
MASMSGCTCLHDDFGPVRRSSGGVWTLLTDANVSPARRQAIAKMTSGSAAERLIDPQGVP